MKRNHKMRNGWVLGFAFALALCCITPASAGTASGKITILGQSNRMAYVSVGPITGKPSCAAISGFSVDQFAIDTSTSTGMAMLSILLKALDQGLSVSIFGLNSCAVWPDRETVDHLYIVPRL